MLWFFVSINGSGFWKITNISTLKSLYETKFKSKMHTNISKIIKHQQNPNGKFQFQKKRMRLFFLFILKSIELIQIKCNEMFSLKIKTYIELGFVHEIATHTISIQTRSKKQ